MSVDFLTTRLEKLKKGSEQIAALDAIRLVRLYLLERLDYREIVKDHVMQEGLEMFRRGHRPFQEPGYLEKFNWKKCSEVIRDLLKSLRKAGLQNGSLQALLDDLDRDKNLAHHLCRASLDNVREHIEILASKYRVEPELLRVISTTPLVPVFTVIRERLPAKNEPVNVRSCTLCGCPPSLGVYQGGFRQLVCNVCGNRIRVDFFFCSRCGSTEPHDFGFLKMDEEPALQVDYCLRCGNYYKMVNEDLMATTVEDPLLLDLSTMDLDGLYRSNVLKESDQQRRQGPVESS